MADVAINVLNINDVVCDKTSDATKTLVKYAKNPRPD